MTKKKKAPATANPILTDSWEIWNYLAEKGRLDPIYYDNEFLNGNSSFNGLSHYLGFKVDKKTIIAKLKKHDVSAEKFIGAFFKVLQPYAQMMNDLCVFFSNYKVNKTNESLKIVFDFGEVTEQLDFNLQNFRTTLSTYTTIKKKVTFYHISELFDLPEIFGRHTSVDQKNLKNKKAAAWLESYRNGKYQKPDLTFEPTGYQGLDQQLNRVLDLWKDFIDTCRTYTDDVKEFLGILWEEKNRQKGNEHNSSKLSEFWDIAIGWSLDNLYAETDRWSAYMLESFYGRLEMLDRLIGPDKDGNAAALEKSLQDYFEGLPRSEKEFDDILEELIEFLNLPVWKKRYELFSTWILSVMDQALTDYEREVHDDKGVLRLDFSATHLMSVQAFGGPFEIWAENRTPLPNPTGHGRKNGIQPDYTIYRPTVGDPKNCLVCVEVKQYKKASVKNFGNALNDYANGLLNANIFLTNYGPVPASLPLVHPTRSAYFGEVRPGTTFLDDFKDALVAALPLPIVPSPEIVAQRQFAQLNIETIHVDVSGSMDEDIIKDYLRAFLTALLKKNDVKKMTALDDSHKYEWRDPDESDIDSLLDEHFYGGGDHSFRSLLTDRSSLILTDRKGAIEMYESGSEPIIIMLEDDQAELYVYSEDQENYTLKATETLDITAARILKGFPGWLYPDEDQPRVSDN